MKTNSLQVILASWLLSLTLTATAQADIVTQEVIVNSSSSSETNFFNGFNVPGGTLIGVSFAWDLTTSNTTVSADTCLVFQDCAPGQAQFSISGSDPAFTPLFDSVDSAAYGFTNDTNATQTALVEDLSLNGMAVLINLSDFLGVGSIGSTTWDFDEDYNFGTPSFADVDSINVNGSLTLTYEFTSDGNVPEPTLLALLGLSLVGFSLAGRRKKI